jgi:ParB-like chromosome segregation protein Spo0J
VKTSANLAASVAFNLKNKNVPPHLIMIAGVDFDASLYPELADPDRIALVDADKSLTPEFLQSLMSHGVRKRPIVIKHPKLGIVCTDGRRRVLGARKLGLETVTVDVQEQGGVAAFETMVIANEHFLEDTVLAKARKMQRAIDMGKSKDEVMALFGISKLTLSNWGYLNKCCPEVIAAIEAGKVTPTVGYDIGKLTNEAQLEALKEAIAAGKGAAAKDAAKRHREKDSDDDGDTDESDGDTKKKERNRKCSTAELRDFMDRLAPTEEEPYTSKDANLEFAHCLMRAILGEGPKALKDYEDVQAVLRKTLRASK